LFSGTLHVVKNRLYFLIMSSLSNKFRSIFLRGSPAEIGQQHGMFLADEIRQCLDFYRGIFALNEEELLAQGQHFGSIIENFSASYASEIKAVADGAGVDARLLFALNSRSEIFNNSSLDSTAAECTTVFSKRDRFLAQNWDWSEKIAPLVVDMQIEKSDGHRIRMLTEPGIIGKIGMNNAGLGVCLNILKSDERLSGVPVHILLRAVLDSTSLQQASDLLQTHNWGKASHVLVADRNGGSFGIEFAGGQSHKLESAADYQLHTNHYLSDASLNGDEMFPSTYERLEQAGKLLDRDASPIGIRNMLTDQTRAELSICKPPTESVTPGFGRVGTLFTVLMDLRSGSMDIRVGSDKKSNFYPVNLGSE
jgi:isopenicillin-N N-acyltransferase-like protein